MTPFATILAASLFLDPVAVADESPFTAGLVPAPCISERYDLGRCPKTFRVWDDVERPDGKIVATNFRTVERQHAPWTWKSYAAAMTSWGTAVGDLSTTAYFMNAPSCVGKVEEANPVVAIGGPAGGPLILLGLKLLLKTATWIAAESHGGVYRERVWIISAVPDAFVTGWNANLIMSRCEG